MQGFYPRALALSPPLTSLLHLRTPCCPLLTSLPCSLPMRHVCSGSCCFVPERATHSSCSTVKHPLVGGLVPPSMQMVSGCLWLCQRERSHLPCTPGWPPAPHSWRVFRGFGERPAAPGPRGGCKHRGPACSRTACA